MKVASAIVLCFALALANGTPCADLTGIWRNELGSNMSIKHLPNNIYKITGQYNTSVESSSGASTISSPIAGMVKPVEGGSVVAFNVLWNRGASITAWVGQCIVCDGKERIFTSWVLRSLMTPMKKWMTTRINQDTFWRLENPREELPVQVAPQVDAINRDILGTWNSISGDAFNLTSASVDGNLEGMHWTPEKDGVAVDIFGSVDGRHNFTALGFSAAGPTEIRGWTGHIYNPQDTSKLMETSWLQHALSNNCNNPRRFVNYGMDNYTQTNPAPGA